MTSKFLIAAVAALVSTPVWAEDEALPSLHCVIHQCQGDHCADTVSLNGIPFSAAVGSDFLFQLTDDWKIASDRYRLVDRKYIGTSYMDKKVLNLTIDRASHALTVGVAVVGSGVEPYSVTATGQCEEIKTRPVVF